MDSRERLFLGEQAAAFFCLILDVLCQLIVLREGRAKRIQRSVQTLLALAEITQLITEQQQIFTQILHGLSKRREGVPDRLRQLFDLSPQLSEQGIVGLDLPVQFTNGRTRQKFCCPFRQSKRGVCPCNHKNWNNGKKNRGCVKYRIIPSDYRLSIDRSCLYFKRTYALRTECERYNSRFKASGQERLWVRNGNSAANLNTLAHISALAVALAAVLSGSHSYRASKSFRRTA